MWFFQHMVPSISFYKQIWKEKKNMSELLVTTTILQIWKVKALSIHIDTYKERLSLYTYRYI